MEYQNIFSKCVKIRRNKGKANNKMIGLNQNILTIKWTIYGLQVTNNKAWQNG